MTDEASQAKKRGRKRKDSTDQIIEAIRNDIPRGINFVDAVIESSPCHDILLSDDLMQLVLAHELDLVRDRRLSEFRETECTVVDESHGIAGGSPVSVRMRFPPQSVYNCLRSVFDQIVYSRTQKSQTNSNMHSFTHESHILLSKTCELIMSEAVCRAYLMASKAASGCVIDRIHITTGLRSAWKSHPCDISGNSSFDFLVDSVGMESSMISPLDRLSIVHFNSHSQ